MAVIEPPLQSNRKGEKSFFKDRPYRCSARGRFCGLSISSRFIRPIHGLFTWWLAGPALSAVAAENGACQRIMVDDMLRLTGNFSLAAPPLRRLVLSKD
jgi:hypothetical protein